MRFFFLLLLIAASSLAIGQSSKIDSLRQLIDKEDDGIKKVKLLNQLSFEFFGLDVEKSGATTEQSLQIAQKINDKGSEGWSFAYRGLYFFLSGSLSEATEYFEQSFTLAKALHDYNLQVYALNQLGNVCRDRGTFDSAYQYYKQAQFTSKAADPYHRSIVSMSIGRYYLATNKPDSALQFFNEALKLRKNTTDLVLLADIRILIGNCYRVMDDLDEAERQYEAANAVSQNDPIVEADYLQNMGEIYFRKGDFQQALANWNKVMMYHRKFQYKYALAELLYRMGAVFEEQGYYDLSLEYLSNGLGIAEKSGYHYLSGRIHNELGWVYYRSLNFEFALKNNIQAEKILKHLKANLEVAGCWDLRGLIERNLKHYDTALYYHQRSLQTRIQLKNNSEISDGYFNLGEFHLQLGRPQTALPNYLKSLAIDNAVGANYGVSLNYNRIGRIYIQLAKFDSAKMYLDKSLGLAIPISANDVFRDNYLDIAAYYEAIGKPKDAIPYYKKYNQVTDSVFSKQTAQSLASYRTLYDVERSEKELELLHKDNKINKTQVQKQRIILYSVVTGFVCLLVLAAFYYRFSKRLKKLNDSLAEKNEEVQIQSEGLVKANEVLLKLNLEIASQKEEIQAQAEELEESNQAISGINESLEERIGVRTLELKQAYKELDTFFYRSSHDFRRPLTTFMGLAEVAKITVKDTAALGLFEKVNETARNLDKMLMKLQSISDLGLQELIYREVLIREKFTNALLLVEQQILQKNIETKIEVDPEFLFYSYPALIKILIENIIENSVCFCARNNPSILMKAFMVNDEVVIQVEDNGQGIEKEYIERVFDMYFRGNELSKGNGLGLYIVKKTADKLNARITLISQPGKGTTISIFFPKVTKRIS